MSSKKSERDAKFKTLNMAEQLTALLSSAVLSNKYIRIVVIVYFVLLHSLVSYALYRQSHPAACPDIHAMGIGMAMPKT